MAGNIDDPITHLKRELGATQQLTQDEVERFMRYRDYGAVCESVAPLVWGLALELVNVNGWKLEPTDLFQEAMLRLLERLPQYNAAASKITTFSHLVASNAMKNYLRDELRSTNHLQCVSEDDVDGASVHDILDYLSMQSEAAAVETDPMAVSMHVEEVLAALPEQQQRALRLRIDGYNLREIASEMAISTAAVDRLVQRGVKNAVVLG